MLARLQTLSAEEVAKIREAFIKNAHMPFGRMEAYAEEVRKASLERLAHLVKICGFLTQTKVYLFWKSQKM